MKATFEIRQRFKERITDAIQVVGDSEELEEALHIINDLDELLEINALVAEYFYDKHMSYDRYDSRDGYHDGFNLNKMYEYIIHRFDLFYGIGIHGGVWRNSKHWIALAVEKLKNLAAKDGMGFTERNIATPVYDPFDINSILIPSAPPAPATPSLPVSHYLPNLKVVINLATKNQPDLLSVLHKTNGAFELTSSKGKIYLIHSYVSQRVILRDSNWITIKVLDDTHSDAIADIIRSYLF